MTPLARLWSWTGHAFILLAIGWAVFVRGGLSDKHVPEGVAISWAYWGVAVSLIAGSALSWTCALYIRAAKREGAQSLVPPNMKFEEPGDRNLFISWSTVVTFGLAVVLSLTVFGVRYADSTLHRWKDNSTVGSGFLGSRLIAYREGCSKPPCFALGSQFDDASKPLDAVDEYLLYVTDGLLCFLAIALALGLTFLVFVRFRLGERETISH